MLDPQTQALLDRLAALGAPPLHTLPVPEAREAYKRSRALSSPPAPEVAKVQALRIPGPAGEIPARLYRGAGTADAAALPVLVYLHGGGWTIGDLDTHDVLCRGLANGARCAVVSVDYRMGPEHRFPAAVDDAEAAVAWVAANAQDLGVDAARVAVGGDSAGGNLATVAALLARDAGGPPLVAQLLIYPATDFHPVTASHRDNAQGYLLTRELMDRFEGCYLGSPAERDDWRASPLLAPDLAGLPQALVLTAGYDPLRDEGRAYAERLAAAGVPVEHVCFERQIHGFVLMGGAIDEANAAVERCARFLARVFG